MRAGPRVNNSSDNFPEKISRPRRNTPSPEYAAAPRGATNQGVVSHFRSQTLSILLQDAVVRSPERFCPVKRNNSSLASCSPSEAWFIDSTYRRASRFHARNGSIKGSTDSRHLQVNKGMHKRCGVAPIQLREEHALSLVLSFFIAGRCLERPKGTSYYFYLRTAPRAEAAKPH